MLKRDYLVKQFEDFGKVLGSLLGLKNAGKFEELESLINNSTLKFTQLEIEDVETYNNETLLDTLTQDKKLTDEQLKMLGDLLYEKGEYYLNDPVNKEAKGITCFEKAKLIYAFLNVHSTLNFSLDMHYKLQVLDKLLTKE
jgi:hypothetical protein